MRIPKNGWLRGVVSLCGFLVMQISFVYGQTQPPRGELKTVKLGLPSISASQMPPLIAKELGYYRQEGFDVEIILMRAVTTVQGLIAGSLDYNGTPGATIAAAVQGLKLRVLVAYSERALYDLVVHPDIASYAALKGRTFGIPSQAGFAYEIPRVMLSKNGIDPKSDVKMIVVGTTQDRLAALKSNGIQATVLEPPYNFLALREGFRKLDFSGNYYQAVFGSLNTSERKIKEETDEVRRFVRATARGLLTFLNEPKVTVPIMQKHLKLRDLQLAEQVYEYVHAATPADGTIGKELMQTIIDEQRRSSAVTRPIAPEEVFDFSIVRESLRTLGGR